MKQLFTLIALLLLTISAQSQTRIQVLVKQVSVFGNVDCDGILTGDSDFVFEFKVTDNSPFNYSTNTGVNNYLGNAGYVYRNGHNGPYTFEVTSLPSDAGVKPSTGVFFDKTYNCLSSTPTQFTLSWMAYENDAINDYSGPSGDFDGETALQVQQMDIPVTDGSQTVTYSASSIDGGCQQNYQIVFEIVRSTEATIPLTAPVFDEQFICNGTTTGVLDAGQVNGFGEITYDWSHDGLGDADDAATVNGVGVGTYTLELKDAQNCTATATQVISPIPDLLPITQFIDSTLDVCVSTTGVHFEIASQAGVTYNWSYSGSGVTIDENGESVTLDFDAGATSGILSVNAQDMCMTTADHTVSITVHELPILQIVGATENCYDTEAILLVQGAQDYVWSTGNMGEELTISPTADMLIGVTGTDAFGCVSYTETTIHVIDYPTVQLAISELEICEGEQVEVEATTDTANELLWNTGATTSLINHTPLSSQFYVVSVSNGTCTTVDSIEVLVNSKPVVDFPMTQTTFCNYNNPVVLQATPTNGVFTGTGVNGNEFNPAVGEGTYLITYSFTDQHGCTSEAANNVVVDACLSLIENEQRGLDVFPNPATSFLTVHSELLIEWIQLIDNSGRIVSSFSPQSAEFEFDLSKFESGSYVLLVILDNKSKQIVRFVKQ